MLSGRELSDIKLQLNSLDGLRGSAILLVLLSHTSNAGINLFPFINFSGVGKSGVFLFFVLSAFLLTLPFVKKGAEAVNKYFLMNYLIRRIFRIYPLYIFYLLLALLTSLVLWKIFNLDRPLGIPFYLSPNDFFGQLFLMQSRGVTWSILVEFRYYFILPILAITYATILKNNVILSTILTIILIVLNDFVWPEMVPPELVTNDPRLRTYLPIFLIGSLLAVLVHRWETSSLSHNKSAVQILEIFGVLAILILIFMIPSVHAYFYGRQISEEFSSNYNQNQLLLFGLLWSIVVFACVAGSGYLKTIFETTLLRFMGFISFSVYLIHVIVLQLVTAFVKVPMPMQGWMVLVLSIIISYASWWLIEKPTSKIRLNSGMTV